MLLYIKYLHTCQNDLLHYICMSTLCLFSAFNTCIFLNCKNVVHALCSFLFSRFSSLLASHLQLLQTYLQPCKR